MTGLSKDSWSPTRDMNNGPPECKHADSDIRWKMIMDDKYV